MGVSAAIPTVLVAPAAVLAAFRGRGTSAVRSMVYWVLPGGAVVRRCVRVRRCGQQLVPGGLCADRDRGGVPHRRRRRGHDRGVIAREVSVTNIVASRC